MMISILLGVSLASLAIALITHATVALVLSRKPGAPRSRPPISILKPVKGVDPSLYRNLASLAEQRYPDFEIVIGAQDPEDPALAVAESLRRNYPSVNITIVAGAAPFGANPKVENLASMVAHARHAHILISDSNVRARPHYVQALAAELDDPEVGLVTSMIMGEGDDTTGATLENLMLNGFIAAATCAARVLARHPCVIGKSMLMGRDQFEALGGFPAVRDVLAEDYVIGQMFHQAGYKVALSPHVLSTINERRSVREFVQRHLRWHQMRRWIAPWIYMAEPLMNPIPGFALLGAVTLAGGAGPVSTGALLAIAGLGILIKMLADALLHQRLSGSALSLRQAMCIPLKDGLVLGMWLVGAVRRSVDWRGNRMRIGPGSRLTPMSDQVVPPGGVLEDAPFEEAI